MACPHKKQDAEIIAEIAKRKAMKNTNKVLEEQPFVNYVWEGSLYDIQLLRINESKIINIRKINATMWEAQVKD